MVAFPARPLGADPKPQDPFDWPTRRSAIVFLLFNYFWLTFSLWSRAAASLLLDLSEPPNEVWGRSWIESHVQGNFQVICVKLCNEGSLGCAGDHAALPEMLLFELP